MGYNATVIVLLDGISEMENDPNFGYNLAEAIKRCAANRKQQDVFASNGKSSSNVAKVLEVHHAGDCRKILLTSNTGFLAERELTEEDKEILGLNKE